MTTSDKPREVDCPCGRDRVAMTKDGNYRRHVPYLRRYNVCLGGKPVPAEMLAKAGAREAERAERRRYDLLTHDVREAEWRHRQAALRRDAAAQALATEEARVVDAAAREEKARKALAEGGAVLYDSWW